MNKVTIKKVPFKLIGDFISEGQEISVKLLNMNSEEVNFNPSKEITIISIFPDINTRVCDSQTQWIAKAATKNPDVKFASITMDDPAITSKWCLAHDIDNIEIYTDAFGEFGQQTGTLIKKLKKLARGFIVIKDGTIVDLAFKKELSEQPSYEVVEKYINMK